MDLKTRAKEELETRVENIESYIARNGIGSGYLNKVEKAQRNINLAAFLGGLFTIIGIASWLFFSGDSEDED